MSFLIEGSDADPFEMWIGGNDIVKEGTFVWVANGQTTTYLNWGPMQPNNRWGNENCVIISKDTAYGFDYTWGDDLCTKEFRYICVMV